MAPEELTGDKANYFFEGWKKCHAVLVEREQEIKRLKEILSHTCGPQALQDLYAERDTLRARRDALVEALKTCKRAFHNHEIQRGWFPIHLVDAALAAGKGGK